MSAALANSILEEVKPEVGFCTNCGGEFRLGLQLWECQVLGCGQVRVWGWMNPADPRLKPRLKCESCDEVTPHAFLGVAGRSY